MDFWIAGALDDEHISGFVFVCFCLSNRMLSRLEMDTSQAKRKTKKWKATNVMNSMQLILKNIIAND